ncbi:hypothetical protein GCM10010106_43400 [Thermopolyspora flexuosa]|nr:hypothetical protein GCM10010106_43400 [Thermopolyspora flexuosa]
MDVPVRAGCGQVPLIRTDEMDLLPEVVESSPIRVADVEVHLLLTVSRLAFTVLRTAVPPREKVRRPYLPSSF